MSATQQQIEYRPPALVDLFHSINPLDPDSVSPELNIQAMLEDHYRSVVGEPVKNWTPYVSALETLFVRMRADISFFTLWLYQHTHTSRKKLLPDPSGRYAVSPGIHSHSEMGNTLAGLSAMLMYLSGRKTPDEHWTLYFRHCSKPYGNPNANQYYSPNNFAANAIMDLIDMANTPGITPGIMVWLRDYITAVKVCCHSNDEMLQEELLPIE